MGARATPHARHARVWHQPLTPYSLTNTPNCTLLSKGEGSSEPLAVSKKRACGFVFGIGETVFLFVC